MYSVCPTCGVIDREPDRLRILQLMVMDKEECFHKDGFGEEFMDIKCKICEIYGAYQAANFPAPLPQFVNVPANVTIKSIRIEYINTTDAAVHVDYVYSA